MHSITEIIDDAGNVTYAAIAIARVHFERESVVDTGCGGSIGSGGRSLELTVTNDDDEVIVTVNLNQHDSDSEIEAILIAFDVTLEAGLIHKTTVAELSEPVWNGHNHVSPDVQEIVNIAGCQCGLSGHWDAEDWLNESCINKDVFTLIAEAADFGVHLDEAEVEEWVDNQIKIGESTEEKE